MVKPQTIARAASARPTRQLAGQVARLENQLKNCMTRWQLTETLGKLGSWETDLETGEVIWSEGTYRVFGVSPDTPVTIDRALSFYSDESANELRRLGAIAASTGVSYDVTLPFTSDKGTKGWVRSLGQLEVTAEGPRLVGVIEDVTTEKEARDAFRKMAFQDVMTSLPNRRSFQSDLAQLMAGREQGSDFAVCLIDIDHFKSINDLHGHAAGDQLLQEIARRLRAEALSGDPVARLGGDEFAVILHGVRTPREAEARVEPFLRAVRQPVHAAGEALATTISIGIAVHDGHKTSPDAFLRCADIALYRAKQAGRNRGCVFLPEFLAEIEAQDRTLSGVRQALSKGEFDVFYQPIVDLRTRVIRGFEALVRWRHPTRGLLLPGTFLAALHDPVLSVEIDDFVMARSLWQARQWLDAGLPLTAVNVNLSEGQLRRGDLVERVEFLLASNGLTPERLKVEVIETAFLGTRTDEIADTLDRLATMGVVSALDDFGTGYASLTHLKQFRIDKIKIDRSFITNLCTDAYDKAIIQSMIDLGRNIGIRVTAEGVETMEQLNLLREMGCDCGQGYLFGRPISGADTHGAVRDWYATKAALLLGAP